MLRLQCRRSHGRGLRRRFEVGVTSRSLVRFSGFHTKSCQSGHDALADPEVESFAFSLDQCCVTIIAYVCKGIFSTTLMDVDLLFNPPASMPVAKRHAFGIEDADIVTYSQFLDEQ